MKVIDYLETFSRKEISLCRKFLKSHSVKSEPKILELYNYLVVSHPKFNAPRLRNEKIFKKLFPNTDFNEKKFANLLAELTRALKDFLASRVSANDKLKDLLDCSQGLSNKGLFEEANKINTEIQEKISSQTYPVIEYTLKLKKLANLQFNYIEQDFNFENMSKGISNLAYAAVQAFLFDFINIEAEMKITSWSHERKVENEISKNVFSKIDIEQWLKLFEQCDYVNKLHLKLYYYKFKTVKEEDNHKFYFKLKDLLLKNVEVLDRSDRYSFFLHLFNVASHKGDENVPEFRREGLSILKAMFKSQSFSPSENAILQMSIFRCVILCCGREEDADWLDHIINKYSPLLPSAQFDNLYNYAKAHLLCLRKEFDESKAFAVMIKDEFLFFKVDIKILYLRSYFELGYIDAAGYEIDNFRHLINNNKLPKNYKVILRNFINLYNKLLKIKEQFLKNKDSINNFDVTSLKEEIIKEKDLACKYWLLEKVDEVISCLNIKI